mgnify:CR=1 FL=1
MVSIAAIITANDMPIEHRPLLITNSSRLIPFAARQQMATTAATISVISIPPMKNTPPLHDRFVHRGGGVTANYEGENAAQQSSAYEV